MFTPDGYLTWISRVYPQIRYDLATSGMASPGMSWIKEILPLDDFGSNVRFQEALAQSYALDPQGIVLTLGTSQALFAVLAALLGPGDRVLVEHPVYEPLWSIPQALGAEVTFFQRSTGFEALDPQGYKVVVVSDPHNPTGHVLAAPQLQDLGERCQQAGAWLLIDEVYRDFLAPTLTTARKLHPQILTVSSLTKVYGLGWIRAGWIFAPVAVSTRSQGILRSLTGNNPPATAALAYAAWQQRELFWQLSHQRAMLNRRIVEQWLLTQPQLSWDPPPAGLFGFIRHSSGADLRPRIEEGLRDHGVLVIPGSFFGDPTGFRLGWSCDSDQLWAGLERLAKVLS